MAPNFFTDTNIFQFLLYRSVRYALKNVSLKIALRLDNLVIIVSSVILQLKIAWSIDWFIYSFDRKYLQYLQFSYVNIYDFFS